MPSAFADMPRKDDSQGQGVRGCHFDAVWGTVPFRRGSRIEWRWAICLLPTGHGGKRPEERKRSRLRATTATCLLMTVEMDWHRALEFARNDHKARLADIWK